MSCELYQEALGEENDLAPDGVTEGRISVTLSIPVNTVGKLGFDSGSGRWKLCVSTATFRGVLDITRFIASRYRGSGVRFGTKSTFSSLLSTVYELGD